MKSIKTYILPNTPHGDFTMPMPDRSAGWKFKFYLYLQSVITMHFIILSVFLLKENLWN